MYQALYRKYRPKELDEIYGQDTIVTIIKNTIMQDKISHAYLFAGPRGTGKTSIAKIFSKIINCEHREDYKACGKCKSCIEKNNSDIIEIDAASNNGVDEIRELKSKIDLVPANGKYKVYIIDEVHMLTIGAFNALLKTLEEPPRHAIFILATTEPHKIPETILSRCQRFDFKKINNHSIEERLKEIADKESIDITDDALGEIARICDGGMRDSVSMLDQLSLYSEGKITIENVHQLNGTITFTELETMIYAISCGKIEKIFEKIDQYDKNGKNFAKIIEQLIDFLKKMLLAKEAPKYYNEKKNENEHFSENINEISSDDIIKYIEEFNDALNKVKNTTNKRLIFELTIIKISQTHVRKKPIIIDNNVENKINNTPPEPQPSASIHESELNPKPIIPVITETIYTNENNFNKVQEITKNETNISKNLELKVDIPREEIEDIKKIRVNNTLAGFNKKLTNQINTQIKTLNEHLLDSSQSKYISIILDGTLKAASTNNIIFMYNTPRDSNVFNQKISQIEVIIQKLLNKSYKVISVNSEEWEKIKQEFNSKKKKYEYIDETSQIKNKNVTNNKKLSDFNDIIEYN